MSEDADETAGEELYRKGLLAFRRGDNVESRRLNEALLTAAVSSGDHRGQALAHLGLSRVCFRDGDFAAGVGHADQADGHAAVCGAEDLQLTALHMRAELTRAQGLYVEALPLYEQLLAADEAGGDEGSLAMEHTNLGSVLVQIGDFAAARSHLESALARLPAKPDLLPYVLLGFGGLLARQGDTQTGGLLLGAVQAHLAACGEVLDPGEALELAGHVAAGRARDDGFPQAVDRGSTMTLEQARTLLGEDPRVQSVRRYWQEAWSQGRVEVLSQFYAATFRENDEELTPESFAGHLVRWREKFTDFRADVDRVWITPDAVITRVVYSGTHSAAFTFLQSTGRTFRVSGLDVFEFDTGGKVAQHWHETDHWELFEQLGFEVGQN